MPAAARTPEELTELLEDALITGDRLDVLFEPAAVVAHRATTARGPAATALLDGLRYVAAPPLVVQAGDVALVLAGRATSVVRRDSSSGWRIVITAIDPGGTTP